MTCGRFHVVGTVGVVLALFVCSPAFAQGKDPHKLLTEADRLAWLRVWTRAEPIYAEASEADDVFHRWAEAWFEGYGWVPIDANFGAGVGPGARGSYFGGRGNRHVVTTVGGGGSDYLAWTYNSHERYELEGGATLDVQPLARYRPAEVGGEVPAARAPAMVSLEVSENNGARDGAGRWVYAGPIAVALVLGVVMGRRPRE
jgi:hypothetical protein